MSRTGQEETQAGSPMRFHSQRLKTDSGASQAVRRGVPHLGSAWAVVGESECPPTPPFNKVCERAHVFLPLRVSEEPLSSAQ